MEDTTCVTMSEASIDVKEGDLAPMKAGTGAPRVLLTDTDRRSYTARVAIGLSRAGCEVSAITTPGHPLLKTRVAKKTFSYSGLRPLESLVTALEVTKPQIVIPCDDRGVQHLHELYARTQQIGKSNEIARLIECSMGAPSSFSIVSSRYALLSLAREEGILVPDTTLFGDHDQIRAGRQNLSYPIVLKSDGSWGGRGVRIADTPEQAESFFHEIAQPFRAGRAIKRFCVNRDPFWIRPFLHGVRPAVVAQSYIEGRPANCAVVCWKGKILAGIAVEVLSAEGPTGPANVVRVVEGHDMLTAAERIANRLSLSGFFGLDFMIQEHTGGSYLIEMNPRCTPPCHLQLGKGKDMIGALWAELSGQEYREQPAITQNDIIAYFPNSEKPDSELLRQSFHDIPDGEPELLQELLQPWPDRSLLFRLNNYLHRITSQARLTPTQRASDSSSGRT
jgi:hypothetical protein